MSKNQAANREVGLIAKDGFSKIDATENHRNVLKRLAKYIVPSNQLGDIIFMAIPTF